MLIAISNQELKVTVDTYGAQMMSIRSASGREYLWQGDPKYWSDRATTIFPFVARLTNNSYTLNGKTYHMDTHGFACSSNFTPVMEADDLLVLELHSDSETKKNYPFDFKLRISFRLIGNTVEISYRVDNLGMDTMPFGIGGHPGFMIDDDENFEDFFLEFSQPCIPDRVGFSHDVYLTGHDEAYPLKENRLIPLNHALFDDDAIILKNMARQITFGSCAGDRSVTVAYPDFPYLGIWHKPKSDAPYVCIEPWSSLPSRQGIVEELTCKSDLIHLHAGSTYRTMWSISVSE